jgi:hypothetical protein
MPPYEQFVSDGYEDLKPHRIKIKAIADLPGFGSTLHERIRKEYASDSEVENRYEALLKELRESGGPESTVGKLFGCASESSGDLREKAMLMGTGKGDIRSGLHTSLEDIKKIVEQTKSPESAALWQSRMDHLRWYKENPKEVVRLREEWRLLLEIRSNLNVGLMIWDYGTINALIHQNDLKKMNFSNVYSEIQSS